MKIILFLISLLLLSACTTTSPLCLEYNQTGESSNWEIQLRHWNQSNCEVWCENVYTQQQCDGKYKWTEGNYGCDCLVTGCEMLKVIQ